MTTVWACEKTVVILKQPGHLTSMKKDRGAGTRVWGVEVSRGLCILKGGDVGGHGENDSGEVLHAGKGRR